MCEQSVGENRQVQKVLKNVKMRAVTTLYVVPLKETAVR